MTTATKLDVKVERTIPASPAEVFEAWLDPAIAGSPWHDHEKLILDAKVDGVWHWRSSGGTPHYGRFLEITQGSRLQYTWMSPYTLGQESTVTVTFQKKGEETLLTLVHSGLPNEDMARAHEKGWTGMYEKFGATFAGRVH